MPRFPPSLVVRALITSITDELERGGCCAFIAVPDEAADASPLPVDASDLARGLGACGAEFRQADLAVSLICCRPVDADPPCRSEHLRFVATDGGRLLVRVDAHGYHAAINTYAL